MRMEIEKGVDGTEILMNGETDRFVDMNRDWFIFI